MTLIAFIGSVFSPYYARARRQTPGGAADPQNHCAVNVALYGRTPAWSMTERGRGQLRRSASRLQIGPSALGWHGRRLQIEVDEVAVPWPRRIRGQVQVEMAQRLDHAVELAEGHRWCPIAPRARVQVDLAGTRWCGSGYLDSNHGDLPLERSFTRWDWSRAHRADGSSEVTYDVEAIGRAPRQIGLRFGVNGSVEASPPLPAAGLPATRWGVRRQARSDAGHPARVLRCLTDAPFYARSVVQAHWHGEPVTVLHESLSLQRFDRAWVQAMLPFRMPRNPG